MEGRRKGDGQRTLESLLIAAFFHPACVCSLSLLRSAVQSSSRSALALRPSESEPL